MGKESHARKNVSWWRGQQKLETGYRHEKRRGNVSRWENPLSRHHPAHAEWHREAGNRERRKNTFPVFESRVFGKTSETPHDFSSVSQEPPSEPQKMDVRPKNPPRTSVKSSEHDTTHTQKPSEPLASSGWGAGHDPRGKRARSTGEGTKGQSRQSFF